MEKEICHPNNQAEQERKETEEFIEEFIEEQQERQRKYPQRETYKPLFYMDEQYVG